MIRNKLYRMFAMMMALVVLLSSTGLGLVEHQCMMRGKTVQLISLGESQGCQMCSKKVAVSDQTQHLPVFKKKACCEETQRHQKVEVVTSVSKSAAKVLKAKNTAADLPVLLSFWLHEATLRVADSPPSSFVSFSSRFHGRSMLSFVQSFLI